MTPSRIAFGCACLLACTAVIAQAPAMPTAEQHRPGQAGLDGGLTATPRPHHPLRRRLVLHLPQVPLVLLQLPPARPDDQCLARPGRAGAAAARRARRPGRGDLHPAGQDRTDDLGPGLQRQLHRWRGGAAQGPRGVRALRRRAAGGRPAHRAVGDQVLLRPDRRHARGRGQAGRERQGGAVRARAQGQRLWRRHHPPGAGHAHRPEIQRELRRPQGRDLGPRARRWRAAAPAGLCRAAELLRIPADL